MHIGVDASCWQNNRGYGRHARALLNALSETDRDNRYTFFVDSEPNGEPLPDGVDVRVVQCKSPTTTAASSSGNRSMADMWRMSRALSAGDLDIVLFPTIYSYVPVFARSKKVVMVHDVIAEKFPSLTLPSWRSRFLWKAKTALGRWQATALATVSEHSRQGIVAHFGMDPDRVFVVGEASDPVFRVLDSPPVTERLASIPFSSDDRNIVYIGGFGPHKNLTMLVDAFAAIAGEDDLRDSKLLLVGEYKNEVFHSCYELIRNRIMDNGLGDRVIFTGFLPDDELVVLLNLATMLVLPSLLEGFGLPAVEAAACGCPVLATTESPLPQLLGEGGLFLDPHSQDAWEQSMTHVLRSPQQRRRMSESGRVAASMLTWEAAAKQMIDIFEKVSEK